MDQNIKRETQTQESIANTSRFMFLKQGVITTSSNLCHCHSCKHIVLIKKHFCNISAEHSLYSFFLFW